MLRKSQQGGGGAALQAKAPPPQGAAGGEGGVVLPDSGYDILEGSGFVLEGLEEKRPKAKPSRKIDGKGAKQESQVRSFLLLLLFLFPLHRPSLLLHLLLQLEAALQQNSQQVLQQRQLKQEHQANLAAFQQNAVYNQQQPAALQQNVVQLQQLEQVVYLGILGP